MAGCLKDLFTCYSACDCIGLVVVSELGEMIEKKRDPDRGKMVIFVLSISLCSSRSIECARDGAYDRRQARPAAKSVAHIMVPLRNSDALLTRTRTSNQSPSSCSAHFQSHFFFDSSVVSGPAGTLGDD